MKLYKSDRKVFAVLNETIELCNYSNSDTLQKYKEKLLDKVADRFERIVAETVLKCMEESVSKPDPLCAELDAVTNSTENVIDDAKTVTGSLRTQKKKK